MAEHVDLALLRLLPKSQLVQHFKTLHGQGHDANTTLAYAKALLEAVSEEVLPPRVMATYIEVNNKTMATFHITLASPSRVVRRASIKLLGHLMQDPHTWESAWGSVDGDEGLADLMSKSSTSEVRLYCKVLGRYLLDLQRAQCIDKLFLRLTTNNSDDRPLFKHYALLLPACTEATIWKVVIEKPSLIAAVDSTRLQRRYPDLFRQHYLQSNSSGSLCSVEARDLRQMLRQVPTTPSFRPGFSATMQYSYDFLKHLNASRTSLSPHLQFYPDLARPLILRAIKRKVKHADVLEIVSLIVEYLELHPEAQKQSSIWDNEKLSASYYGSEEADPSKQKRSFLWVLVRLWYRRPDMYRASLQELLAMAPENLLPSSRHSLTTERWATLLSSVTSLKSCPISRRHDLLYLILSKRSNRSGLDVDIQRFLPDRIDLKIFLWLERPRARQLLRRLLSPRRNHEVLANAEGSIFVCLPVSESPQNDAEVLDIYLRTHLDAEAVTLAKVHVEKSQQLAKQSRDQTDRANHAIHAIHMAVASGSLSILADTVTWTKRFSRDPQTIQELNAVDCICTPQIIELLSCIPSSLSRLELDPHERRQTLKQEVEASHAILLSMIETACISIREPFFKAYKWSSVFMLIGEVVKRRIENMPQMQKFCEMSEETFYSTFWQPALKFLTTTEAMLLEPGNEILLRDSKSGRGGVLPEAPFESLHVRSTAVVATRRFLEDLATARDTLWFKHRRSTTPAVVAIGTPWPKGLPIQCLVPLDASSILLPPCVVGRAKEIVFMVSHLALSTVPTTSQDHTAEQKEFLSAVGSYVDDFVYALKVYVLRSNLPSERVARIKSAWNHALEHLSDKRLTQAQSECIWKPVFEQAEMKPPMIREQDQWQPKVPASEDYSAPCEWDPADQLTYGTPLSVMPQTAIACIVDRHGATDMTPLLDRSPRAVSNKASPFFRLQHERPRLWNRNPHNVSQQPTRFIVPSTREALILAAMLFIDSRKSGGNRLLTRPYPAASPHRYPAVYLSDEFLALGDEVVKEAGAVDVLKYLSPDVPPNLLADLTRNVVSCLVYATPDTPESRKLENLGINLIILLGKGDRPELACDMILQIVLDMPDVSSWHRRLLAPSFFQILMPGQVQGFLTKFNSAVEARSRSQTLTATIDKPKTPHIKISTIKALAQLLNGASFASLSSTLGMLRSIFQKVRHIDVRVAVLDYFLETFRHDSEHSEELLSAIEDAIPIAASFDERAYSRKADAWHHTDNDELPDISIVLDARRTPLLSTLVRHVPSLGIVQRKLFVRRIIAPILVLSMKNQSKWVQMFGRRYGLEVHGLPALSIQPAFLLACIQEVSMDFDVAGVSLLESLTSYILVQISPPPSVGSFLDRLTTPASKASNAISYMSSLLEYSSDKLPEGMSDMVALLATTRDGTERLKLDPIEHAVRQVAHALINHCGDSLKRWNVFIHLFSPPMKGREAEQVAWASYMRPALSDMIDYIDTYRTSHWQHAADREPAFLPPTIDMKLWCLSEHAQDGGMTINAEQLLAQILVPLASQSVYHEEFLKLQNFLHTIDDQASEKLVVDLLTLRNVTKQEEGDRMALLVVELVSNLAATMPPSSRREHADVLDDVVDGWSRSYNESVRVKALSLKRLLNQENESEGDGEHEYIDAFDPDGRRVRVRLSGSRRGRRRGRGRERGR